MSAWPGRELRALLIERRKRQGVGATYAPTPSFFDFKGALLRTQTRENAKVGSGGSHAKYAAYVRDKSMLDLDGVPRDNLNLKAGER